MEDVVDPEAGALDFEGLTALLNRRALQGRDHYTALRNALLRGHGAILSDRERSLISNVLHVLVADMGETFRRALAARRSEHDAAAEAVAAWTAGGFPLVPGILAGLEKRSWDVWVVEQCGEPEDEILP